MKRFRDLRLRWRLLVAFAACAVIAVAAVAVAIASLNKIHSSLADTAQQVSSNIETQNEQSRNIVALRELVVRVGYCEDDDELDEAEDDLDVLAERWSDPEVQPLLRDIRDDYLSHRLDYLAALEDSESARKQIREDRGALHALCKDITELQKASQQQLSAVSKASMEIGDSVEFDSVLAIEDAAEQIKTRTVQTTVELVSGLDRMSETTDGILGAVKNALSVRACCHELDALIKDALLATDEAMVDYCHGQVSDALSRGETHLEALGKSDETESMSTLLETLSQRVDELMGKKKRAVLLQAGRAASSPGKRSPAGEGTDAGGVSPPGPGFAAEGLLCRC